VHCEDDLAALDATVAGQAAVARADGLIRVIKALKPLWSGSPRADDIQGFCKNSQKSLSNRMK